MNAAREQTERRKVPEAQGGPRVTEGSGLSDPRIVACHRWQGGGDQWHRWSRHLTALRETLGGEVLPQGSHMRAVKTCHVVPFPENVERDHQSKENNCHVR